MDGRPQTKGIIVIRFGSAFRRHACIDLATPETQTPENAPRLQAAKLLYQFAPHLAERRSVHQQHARLIEPDVPVRRLEPEAFMKAVLLDQAVFIHRSAPARSEEHTSELQSLMRISYAVFCLKTKTLQSVNMTHGSKHTRKHDRDKLTPHYTTRKLNSNTQSHTAPNTPNTL